MIRSLAIVAPLMVLSTVGWALTRTPALGEPVGPATEMARQMAVGPDLVVVGNSKVMTDLDLVGWSKDLPGQPVVAQLQLNGTGMPLWYAAFKRQVVDAGYKPKVVVVYAPLNRVAETRLWGSDQTKLLNDLLGTPDPVINAKVFGKAKVNPLWARAQDTRTTWHGSLMDGLRNAAVGAFVAKEPGPILERGAALAVPALATVFDANRMMTTERARSVPIAEVAEATGGGPAVGAEQTLLPDFVALAKGIGADVVFVRSPLARTRSNLDLLPAALEADVIAEMGRLGAAYVDLREYGPPDSGYGDGTHMNPTGRRAFAPVLTAELVRVGVGSGQPVTPADPTPKHPRPQFTRTGLGPALPPFEWVRGKQACDHQALIRGWEALADSRLLEMGLGEVSPLRVLEDGVPLPAHVSPMRLSDACGGGSYVWKDVVKFTPTGSRAEASAERTYALVLDSSLPVIGSQFEQAWWVYPNSTMNVDFVPGSLRAGARFSIAAVPVDLGGPGQAVAEGGGSDVVFTSEGPSRVARGELRGDRLRIRNPADGAFLLVTRLSLGTPEDTWHVLGRSPVDTRIDVLKLAGGDWPRPPQPIYGPHARPVEAGWRPTLWVFPVGHLGIPSLEDTSRRTGSTCSPLRLMVDGQPESTPSPSGVAGETLAQSTHSADRLLVQMWDKSPVPQNPNALSFYLDPSRACVNGRWLYPRDVAIFSLAGEHLAALREAAQSVGITGTVFSPELATGPITLSVVADGVTALETTVEPSRLEEGSLVLPLQRPIPRDTKVVRITVDTGDKAGSGMWVVLTEVSLIEPPAALF